MKAFAESLRSIDIKINTSAIIEIHHDKKVLLEGLVNQLNEDVISKMEHDVELRTIKLKENNVLHIDGFAKAMGIQKEFLVKSRLVWNKDEQALGLKVDSIDIQGSFLVQRGFDLVEPTVRGQIEKAVHFNLLDLIPNPIYAGEVSGFPERMIAAITRALVHDIVLSNKEDNVFIELMVEDFKFSFAPSARFRG